MAQQFLNLPQIRAILQQMRRKAVPQGVGCGGIGQAERYTDLPHGPLGHTLVEALPSCAEEQRGFRLSRAGACGQIFIHGFSYDRQNGDLPFLASLTRDDQEIMAALKVADV